MNSAHGVVVVGSMTADVTAVSKKLPRSGETVLGTGFTLVSGGKGSNQAVMASNMGVQTWMVGCVGDDPFQHVILDSLRVHGVDTTFVDCLSGESTGVAHIRVDESGNNDIVIVPMANNRTNAEQVDAFFAHNPKANILLLQLEVPAATALYAAKKAKALGIIVIFDPAPAIPFLDEMYRYVDIVTPNETEATALTGIEVTDLQSAEAAAHVLQEKGVQTVIITMADKGIFVLEGQNPGTFQPILFLRLIQRQLGMPLQAR